jgi:hypothetical protein
MTRPVMLTTSHGDGAGVRVTPETLRAVRDELRVLVIEAHDLHHEANFGRTAQDRADAAEQAEEADDNVLQYLSHILGGA